MSKSLKIFFLITMVCFNSLLAQKIEVPDYPALAFQYYKDSIHPLHLNCKRKLKVLHKLKQHTYPVENKNCDDFLKDIELNGYMTMNYDNPIINFGTLESNKFKVVKTVNNKLPRLEIYTPIIVNKSYLIFMLYAAHWDPVNRDCSNETYYQFYIKMNLQGEILEHYTPSGSKPCLYIFQN